MAALGHLSAAVAYGTAPARLQRRPSARRAAARGRAAVLNVAASTDYDTVIVGAGVSGKAYGVAPRRFRNKDVAT